MLELIFRGFIEWLYGLILECWEYFPSELIQLMSMDFAYLKHEIPILDAIQQSMLALGWALLIGNLVFQVARSMLTGLGFEAEAPKLLFSRTFVFSFLLLASPQLCDLCLEMTSRAVAEVEMPDAVRVTLAAEGVFGSLNCAWLLVIICGSVVCKQYTG